MVYGVWYVHSGNEQVGTMRLKFNRASKITFDSQVENHHKVFLDDGTHFVAHFADSMKCLTLYLPPLKKKAACNHPSQKSRTRVHVSVCMEGICVHGGCLCREGVCVHGGCLCAGRVFVCRECARRMFVCREGVCVGRVFV